MSNKRKKKRSRSWLSTHKFEAGVYVVGVLLLVGVVLGIVKLTTRDKDPAETSQGISGNSQAADSKAGFSAGLSKADSVADIADSSSAEPSSGGSSSAAASSAAGSSKASSPSVSSVRPAQGDYIHYTKSGVEELDEWYLKLVNKKNKLPDGWSDSEITRVKNESNGEYYRIDTRILQAYNDMVNAAKDDGVYLYPISAYRAQEDQERLFNNRVARAKKENPSFTDEEAYIEASKHVSIPRTSEHELGLAVDFNSVDETNFRYTKEAKWLAAHCTDYGFVIRYPESRESITGVVYEPWHVRFVGVKHAKRMNDLGMCLEEYIEHIRSGGN